jgi:hypothetical protein
MTPKNRIESDPPTHVRVIVTTLEIDRTAVRFRFTGMQDLSIESSDRQAKELADGRPECVGGKDSDPGSSR